MAHGRSFELSAKKRTLLEALLQEEGIDTSNTQKISPRGQTNSAPLSFAQESLWFFDQMMPDSPAYNIPTSVRLSGPLNETALEQSIHEIIQRHEILRVTFKVQNELPIQSIAPTLALPLTVVDFQEVPEAEREDKALQWAFEEAHKPFDLKQGPLLRVALLKLGPEEYIFLLTMHHIISEASSIVIFFQELSALYEAFAAGKPSPLPPLAIQYGDFTLWQRQHVQNGSLDPQLAYWKQQLSEPVPVLELPIDRPRPTVRTFQGTWQSRLLPSSLTGAIKMLSRQEGATLFMTLLAAFKVLLFRYTGQRDILVGSPTTDRNRPELERLIGYFVNTHVLRTQVSDNLTFRELLGRVREVCLAAYSYQDVPFERLIEELHLERDPSINPLFQTAFLLQNASAQPSWRNVLNLPGITQNTSVVRTKTAKIDLTLEIEATEDDIIALFDYNVDLFNDDTIARMLENFQTLLEGIVADPDQPLSTLPLLTKAERHQVFVEWNDTQTTYPQDRYVHQLFEAQAELTPNTTAAIFADNQLTYRELNQRANQLAHHLMRIGIGPEMVVGICMGRSLAMVVGLLGILKAGGAYMPLDPTYPKERLTYMLNDSRASVLLTQEKLIAYLPQTDTKVISLDSSWTMFAHESEDNPSIPVNSNNLAYLIYTSGSTGQPKGVEIPHRALVNHNMGIIENYELQASDHVLQFASISFDVAAEEIFPTLLCGGTLVLRSDEIIGSVQDFLQFVRQEKLTVVNLPTPYWHEWVSELSLSEVQMPPTLRLVVVGSDKASSKHYATWRKLVKDQVGWRNAYGPTEATITTTIYKPDDRWEKSDNHLVPIGRPIANSQIYILDKNLQPVPIGVMGELLIGGAGLARGYFNRPELTNEKFIRNPFSNDSNACLYKTGDIARYLPDGNIEFLGRIDNQVKIRGFRIELGEIESILGQHPLVDQCIVFAHDETGEKRLVAYIVPGEEKTHIVNELRTFAKAKLPDYMVPSAFVILDSMPLMPNGKVDHKQLPKPDGLRPELEVDFVIPQNETELAIAAIWQEVLQVAKVGVYDNFFDLGGHSLLLTKVYNKLQTQFDTKLSIIDLFQYPTINSLTKYLSHGREEQSSAPQGLSRAETRKMRMEQRQRVRSKTARQNKAKRRST